MTKPISEYTENELAELAGSDYVRRMLAAEVMRLRQLDEVTIRHWREQMARAERAEAELASWTTVACQQTDTIDELTSELAAARGEHYTALEQRDTAMADFIKADDELAQQKPVIDAAVRHAVDPDDWTFRALERNVGAYREGADQ
jgi:hypothetical protein